MSQNIKFSIIVPVYQNEKNLDDSIPKLLSLKEKLANVTLELIFVDDGSSDASYEILSRYREKNKKTIKIIKFTKNFGQNPAISAGLQATTGDCVGIISADLQDPYELFVEMFERWKAGDKLVIGERVDREEAITHTFFSRAFWVLLRKYVLKDLPVGGFDFCLIDGQIRDDLNRITEKNTPIFPLIFWLGYRPHIISYTRKVRTAGKSQWNFSKKFKLTVDTITSLTYLPVRLISVLGLVLSFLSFSYTFIILFRWFIFKSTVPGWTTLALLTSFLGGMMLLSLGIIGEYVWRILDEVRKKPGYIIDEVLADDKKDK